MLIKSRYGDLTHEQKEIDAQSTRQSATADALAHFDSVAKPADRDALKVSPAEGMSERAQEEYILAVELKNETFTAIKVKPFLGTCKATAMQECYGSRDKFRRDFSVKILTSGNVFIVVKTWLLPSDPSEEPRLYSLLIYRDEICRTDNSLLDLVLTLYPGLGRQKLSELSMELAGKIAKKQQLIA